VNDIRKRIQLHEIKENSTSFNTMTEKKQQINS